MAKDFPDDKYDYRLKPEMRADLERAYVQIVQMRALISAGRYISPYLRRLEILRTLHGVFTTLGGSFKGASSALSRVREFGEAIVAGAAFKRLDALLDHEAHLGTVDLRVRDAATGREFEERILGLKPIDPDVKLKVTGGMNRPPFEKTAGIDALLRHAQALAREIGFPLADTIMTGGGSDGNFTAAIGVPTLDGLGIDGDGAHTESEHGYISSIEPRTRLMRRLFETLQ